MGNVSGRVWRGAMLVAAITLLSAPMGWADEQPIAAPLQGRIQPPVGVTAQVRLQPPVGVIPQHRIQPPVGIAQPLHPTLMQLFRSWLSGRMGIPIP
jgi:hypothetical protein